MPAKPCPQPGQNVKQAADCTARPRNHALLMSHAKIQTNYFGPRHMQGRHSLPVPWLMSAVVRQFALIYYLQLRRYARNFTSDISGPRQTAPKMADVLAISAAVVQFLDITIRLSLQLSRLYKELHDVPQKLQSLNADLNQQIAIAQYVKSRHAAFWHGSPAASAGAMPFADQGLADYVAVMERLLEAVELLAKPDSTAGIVSKSWNTLRATQKCREAVALCDTLERKKSNITLWLCTANTCVMLSIHPAHLETVSADAS